MTQGHNSQHLDQRLDAYDPPCPADSFASPTAHDALVHAWDLIQHGSRPRRPAPPRPKMSRRDRRPRVTLRDRTDLRDTKALARRLEAAIRVVTNPAPWIRRLALRIRRNGAPDPAKLAKPQKVRVARPVPTLDALGAELRLGPVPRHDNS